MYTHTNTRMHTHTHTLSLSHSRPGPTRATTTGISSAAAPTADGSWLIAASHSNRHLFFFPIEMWHDSFIGERNHYVWHAHSYVKWPIHMWLMCDITHSYVKWLIHTWLICDMIHSYVKWPIQMWLTCDTTHSYVKWPINMWFTRSMTHSYVKWLIQIWLTRDMTHSYVKWLIHMWLICDMTHSIFSFKPTSVSCHIWVTYEWVISHINESCHAMSHMSHIWMSHFTDTMCIFSFKPTSVLAIHSHVTWLVYMWHASFICMTHSYITDLMYIWYGTFTRIFNFIHLRHDSLRRDMTREYATCLFICGISYIHMRHTCKYKLIILIHTPQTHH